MLTKNGVIIRSADFRDISAQPRLGRGEICIFTVDVAPEREAVLCDGDRVDTACWKF